MMKLAVSLLAILVTAMVAWSAEAQTDLNKEYQLARGKYIVNALADCTGCHTPRDRTGQFIKERFLAGVPEGSKPGAGPPGNVGFTGPWGTSFPANLTPDKETGLGGLSFTDFDNAMRRGLYKDPKTGTTRAMLPEHPWMGYQNMTDDDVRAIWAYLQTIPAVKNRVPAPVPPARR